MLGKGGFGEVCACQSRVSGKISGFSLFMADPTFMALIGGLGFLMKFVPANLKFLVSLEYVKTWNMP